MTRRSIIERRSLDIDLVQYTDYFMVLANYYSQYDLEREVISCHRSIIRRTDAHLDTCSHYQCNYYDIGDAYYSMREYQKAAELFEKALGRGNKLSIHGLRSLIMDDLEHLKILMKLYYTYNNLKEYEEAASILSDINDLRPKISETPTEKLFSNSDTVQSAVGLFKDLGYIRDAMLLEEKLMSSVKDVGLKVVHAPWKLGIGLRLQIDRESKVPLDVAYNVANHLYKNEEYVETIEMVIYFIDILKNTTNFRNKIILFHVLLGKAMFSIGNYSEGMNEMELALNIIQTLENPFSYEETKSTICWYLIPRVRHIEICYNVSQVLLKIVYYTTSFILYVIFSPHPFALPNSITSNNQHFWSSSMPGPLTSQSSEVIPTIQYFGALSSTTVNSVRNLATSVVDDRLRIIQYSVTEIVAVLLNILTMIYHVLCIPIWIIIVWVKLLWIFSKIFRYSSQKLNQMSYYCTSVPFIIYHFFMLQNSNERPNLKLILRFVRDPRLMIFYLELDVNTKNQWNLMNFLFFTSPMVLLYMIHMTLSLGQ